jgi:bifunctional non-homologous end joining protein LigD
MSVRAMRATPGDLPDGEDWAYEMSWGAPRLLVDVTRNRVSAWDERDRDVTIRYPELVAMAGDLTDALFDGHVFSAADTSITFVAIDLLRLYGVDLTDRTYSERRRTLLRLAADRNTLTVIDAFDDPDATEAAAREHSVSAVVAKRLDSPYVFGTVTADWIEHGLEVVED